MTVKAYLGVFSFRTSESCASVNRYVVHAVQISVTACAGIELTCTVSVMEHCMDF